MARSFTSNVSSLDEFKKFVLTDFAIIHLQSAAHLARLAHEIESQFSQSNVISTENRERYMTYSIHSVIASFAFLEASINKLIMEACSENHVARLQTLGAETRTRIAELARLNLLSAPNPLPRFQTVLIVADQEKFDAGQNLYQRADILRALRNFLIHYKPEWIEIDGKPVTVEKVLANQPISNTPFPGTPDFPRRLLNHSCADWALSTALAFADDFYTRLNVDCGYDHIRANLSTTS